MYESDDPYQFEPTGPAELEDRDLAAVLALVASAVDGPVRFSDPSVLYADLHCALRLLCECGPRRGAERPFSVESVGAMQPVWYCAVRLQNREPPGVVLADTPYGALRRGNFSVEGLDETFHAVLQHMFALAVLFKPPPGFEELRLFVTRLDEAGAFAPGNPIDVERGNREILLLPRPSAPARALFVKRLRFSPDRLCSFSGTLLEMCMAYNEAVWRLNTVPRSETVGGA